MSCKEYHMGNMKTTSLLDLDVPSIEKILHCLPVIDCLHVATSCKRLKDIVNSYLDHVCEQYKCAYYVQRYFTIFNAESCMDKSALSEKDKFQSGNYSKAWLYVVGMPKYRVLRQTVCAVDWFPHSSNPHYMSVEYNLALDRNIVKLISVCWLEISHTFKDVEPGTYKYSVHVMIPERPLIQEPGTTLSVYWKENGQEKTVDRTILPAEWISFSVSGMNTWFNVDLDHFKISVVADVTVAFHNKSSWWQSGLCWDYVEICQLS